MISPGRKSIPIVFLTVTLFVFWLLMSGIYQPLIIGFGVISAVYCVWIAKKLGIVGPQSMFSSIRPVKLFSYLSWLIVEVMKADWAVTKVIISKNLPSRQRLLLVPAIQLTDFGKTLFANSITITPGTVTVETGSDHFIVHALTDEAADKSVLAEMGNSVSAVEREIL